MSNEQLTTTVNILDKDYRISCPPEEQEALTSAARYLDSKMREIRASGKVIGLERIAVMAALNIAHDMLISSREANALKEDTQRHIQILVERLDDALLEHNQLEL
ncbi:cell division protein ZapA [Kistimonas asteriae]|uniref:cell division protein ZapA n=1 Tax=Kistimonas asteriae TaxID=517724 RepID=UPI001BA603EA|nr:cell division protein ZapA [Kistimonas asteriae]